MWRVGDPVTYDYASQPKVDVPICPVCETANSPKRLTDRWGFAIGLSHCRCGLGYLNPRLTPEGYADFYAHWYRPLIAEYEHRPTDLARSERYQRGYGRELAVVCQEATGLHILDAGGSTGAISEGWSQKRTVETVTVLDPSPVELLRAQAKGYRTILGTLEATPLPVDAFDLVLCIQTCDHFYDPVPAFRRLASAATANAWFVVDYLRGTIAAPLLTPGGNTGLMYKQWKPKIDHPLYWTRKSLEQALTLAGWTVAHRRFTSRKGVVLCRKS